MAKETFFEKRAAQDQQEVRDRRDAEAGAQGAAETREREAEEQDAAERAVAERREREAAANAEAERDAAQRAAAERREREEENARVLAAKKANAEAHEQVFGFAREIVKDATPSGFVLVRASGAARPRCRGRQIFFLREDFLQANLNQRAVFEVDPTLDLTGRELLRLADGEVPQEI